MWPLGQAVKTPPSHGGIRGSIPLEATKKKELKKTLFLLFYICANRTGRERSQWLDEAICPGVIGL